MDYRTETDALGSKEIPSQAYWGVQTQRALENFNLSGRKTSMALIRAVAMVKKAAAQTNCELKELPQEKSDAIIKACDEIIHGQWSDHFIVDALQGGAGTSTNMNVNEVIASRACEILGAAKGDRHVVCPHDDVNLYQSTNDVYPTAFKIAVIAQIRILAEGVAGLQGALQRKEKEFAAIVKIGRTEWQEAVPITLGMEFGAWAEAIGRDRWRTFKCEERLRVVNLGGTAIGTGLGARRDYIFLVIEKLRVVSGMNLTRAENLPGDTANADVFVEVSGILKAHAVDLIKIANDLRMLNYLKEIRLPQLQPGSSIMPGKVNPVVAEAVMQAGMRVLANDGLIAQAASRGSFQIVEFLPLVADALLESLGLLINADRMLAAYIEGIEADPGQCRFYFDRSHALITAFVPLLGFAQCDDLLKQFTASGQDDLRAFLMEKLGAAMVEKCLDPNSLMALGYKK